MKHRFLIMLVILTSVIVTLPVSFFITIFLTPLWSFIESTTGFESIGHSGPSEWCFVAIYTLLVTAEFITLFHLIRLRKNSSGNAFN